MRKRYRDGGRFVAKNFGDFEQLHVEYERMPDEPDIGICGVYEITGASVRGDSVLGQLSMHEIDLLEQMAANDYQSTWRAAAAAFA